MNILLARLTTEDTVSNRKILVVDDEASVRKMIVSILAFAGYQKIMEAGDGIAACELMSECASELKLVITDIRMPRMNGAELTTRIRADYPEIKVLCVSAYSDPLSPNGHYFLAKPFTPKALLAMVRDVFEVPADRGVSD